MKLKGYKKENKITTKNMLIAFGVIIILMAVIGIYRTYAIYKLQKEYDVIKSKIGEFNNGDVKVAVLVDGEESSFFPTYEDNYKVESIECTNGVTGQWDVVNWRLIIDDMSATSTKCTISFNSNETNEEAPIAYSKEELLALNEEYQNVAYNNLKTQLLNDTYPVGSIYMSTEDDTVEKVKAKFGGTWVKYNEGQMLMSAGTTYAVNSTGGSSTVTLVSNQIPSLSVSGTTDSTGSGYGIEYGSTWRTTTTNGAHSHIPTNGAGSGFATFDVSNDIYATGARYAASNGVYYASYSAETNITGDHTHSSLDYYVSSISGVEEHTHTFTGNYKNNKQSSINIQNPYTAVYMYKRTA